MGMNREDIPSIFHHFSCKGTYHDHRLYGSGHIHETWLVITTEPYAPDYILQKINRDIFKDIPALMENICLVASHLAERSSRSLQLLMTNGNQSYYTDDQGESWRLFAYISDSITIDRIRNLHQACEAGRAIGNFQNLLSDLGASLRMTLPGFHDPDLRMEEFRSACQQDRCNRSVAVTSEIDTADRLYYLMAPLRNEIASHRFPLRVTHNDTKLNNILFDRNDNAICLIDLDTVMPGYVLYDYGDALRTMSNTAAEDEQDLSQVRFDFHVFEAFTRGYLSEAGKFLRPEEKEWLWLAPACMTFIIGLRFLTDHINGDRYFHIHREGHNLDRARVQFTFAGELIRYQEQIHQYLAVKESI